MTEVPVGLKVPGQKRGEAWLPLLISRGRGSRSPCCHAIPNSCSCRMLLGSTQSIIPLGWGVTWCLSRPGH